LNGTTLLLRNEKIKISSVEQETLTKFYRWNLALPNEWTHVPNSAAQICCCLLDSE